MKEKKFRFALNILGILIGCMAITGLVSITQGLSEEVTGQLEIFGPRSIMIIPGEIRRGRGYVGGSFSWHDLDIVSNLAHVQYAAPIIGNVLCSHTMKGETYLSDIYGTNSDYFIIFKNYEIAKGRALYRSDSAVAVLGANVAHPSDEDEPIYEVGDRIKLKANLADEEREMVFRVVGVLEKIGGTFGSEDDNAITIPLRICQQLFDLKNEISFIAVQVDDLKKVDSVVEEIEERFGEDIMIMTSKKAQEMAEEILGTIEKVLGGIAAISLLVAGVGIINTMLISVLERTREIGILKSIGAKKREIMLIFLCEVSLTGLIGGILGTTLGFVLGKIIGNYINLPVTNSPTLGVYVTLFAVISSIISGLYPAWKASNLDPVESLRFE